MMYYVPNLLTFARIGLVPFLIVLLQDRQYLLALGVFLVAGLSDALDGYIAKRFNAQTRLGALLDPLADKALIVSAYVTLSVLELIPFWLVVAVVFRDVLILVGILIMTLYYGSLEMSPLKVSKINTFFQILYILVVLGALAGVHILVDVSNVLAVLVLITSVVSGVAYVYIGTVVTMQPSTQTKSD